MNAYFRNLYDTAKGLDQGIRILTPTMAQFNYAERVVFTGCDLNVLFVPGIGSTQAAGYDYMEETYRYKNDGIAWHNYWFQAKEFWSESFLVIPIIRLATMWPNISQPTCRTKLPQAANQLLR